MPEQIEKWEATYFYKAKYDEWHVAFRTYDKAPGMLMGIFPDGFPRFSSNKEEVGRAVERLSATWNACAGLPTSLLLPGSVKRLAEAAQAVVNAAGVSCEQTFREMNSLREAIAPFKE